MSGPDAGNQIGLGWHKHEVSYGLFLALLTAPFGMAATGRVCGSARAAEQSHLSFA
jgi:hypothetical protein